jgi:hypothetical protein
MSKDLEKTEALIAKVKAELENITAKKTDILEKEKNALARLEQLENTRVLQIVNLSNVDGDTLKRLLMAARPKPVPQKPEPIISTTNERITENEEDE